MHDWVEYGAIEGSSGDAEALAISETGTRSYGWGDVGLSKVIAFEEERFAGLL